MARWEERLLDGGREDRGPDVARGDGVRVGALSGEWSWRCGRGDGVAAFVSDSSLMAMATGKSAVPSSTCGGSWLEGGRSGCA